MPHDHEQALKLWQQAGELGNAAAYQIIGNAYYHGRGVEKDNKKADYYYELAAVGGGEMARHNLGCSESDAGNWDRATKHWLIAAGDGDNNSVKAVQQLYKHGLATKDDYTKVLQTYQAYLDEIKSDQRDKAATFNDIYKYY